ncbi:hypothetical protein CARUB_v10002976mg [Capsella rubella]|uniref:Uncharacterized protein n=1 Tax=Capsella rubella TaxID=81985 RepID=R0FCU1_9BRAS|nr:hypothetical protein CARUB_v10002976mg [Capsella rubella]
MATYAHTEDVLWFLIHEFVTSYCTRRGIAMSQLTIASTRNAVVLVILEASCNVIVYVVLFEEATIMASSKDNPGLCSTNVVSVHKICDKVKSKVGDWRWMYFYLKVAKDSICLLKVSRSASGSVPPSSSRLRKRSSRGSPLNAPRGDVREVPFREVAESVDHSFSYSYGVRDQKLCTNRVACACLTSKIHGDFPQLPLVGSLLGQKLYEDRACEKFKIRNISRTNHLVGFYEEKSRTAMREVDLTKASLEARKRGSLRCSWNTSERPRERLPPRRPNEGGLVSRHVVGLRAQKDPLLILSQVKGTQECLQRLITEGTSLLDKMGKLATDRAKWQSIIDGIVVSGILEGDLDFFPGFTPDPSRMPPRDEGQGAEEADGAEGVEGGHD